MSVPNNEKWKEFIEAYKSFPELWQPKCEDYKNKNVRHNAWRKLFEKYKEIDENGTIEILKKRVNNLRTCYRRELKKLLYREKYAICSDVVYKPSLWYFENLNFLRDSDNDDIEDIPNLKRRKIVKAVRRTNFIKKELQVNHFNELKDKRVVEVEKDDAMIYSESWAVSFRKLTEHQKLFAKKAIEEILILGQLNQLTLNSVIQPDLSETEFHACSTEFQFDDTSS